MKCFPLSLQSTDMCDEKIPELEKHMGREVEKFSQLSEKGHVQMIFDSTDFHLSRLVL